MSETANRRNGERARKPTRHFRDLEVYQNAFKAALRVYELSTNFPLEEKYSLTDQIRRSSRSVCANIGEAWRKRRYEAAFVAKLSDSEGEAAETQVHLEFAFHHRYVSRVGFLGVDDAFEKICAQLVRMTLLNRRGNGLFSIKRRLIGWRAKCAQIIGTAPCRGNDPNSWVVQSARRTRHSP